MSHALGAAFQCGILELLDPDASLLLVFARDPCQSHTCWKLLGRCEDPEVVRQDDIEGDTG